MGRGVKIGGSRGPKCRLDPLLGPFLIILSHFGPFWAFFDPFWPFGWGGAKAPSGSVPPKVGVKWGGESKLTSLNPPAGTRGPSCGALWAPNGPGGGSHCGALRERMPHRPIRLASLAQTVCLTRASPRISICLSGNSGNSEKFGEIRGNSGKFGEIREKAYPQVWLTPTYHRFWR